MFVIWERLYAHPVDLVHARWIWEAISCSGTKL